MAEGKGSGIPQGDEDQQECPRINQVFFGLPDHLCRPEPNLDFSEAIAEKTRAIVQRIGQLAAELQEGDMKTETATSENCVNLLRTGAAEFPDMETETVMSENCVNLLRTGAAEFPGMETETVMSENCVNLLRTGAAEFPDEGSWSGVAFPSHWKEIKEAISKCGDDLGMRIDEIPDAFPRLSRQHIDEALEFLLNEGHIYNTINENYVKVLEGGQECKVEVELLFDAD